MAKEEKIKDETMIQVPQSILIKMQEQMAEFERQREEDTAKMQGLEQMVNDTASTIGDKKIREKKSFEPKFRTVRLRKYPINGDENNIGYIVGWTKKGAYQEVDRTNGVRPEIVDMIDVVFLGNEKVSEKVRLLDMLNKSSQVFCKILEQKVTPVTHETGEQIHVTTFDPQHGLIDTGEIVDGFVSSSEIKYKIQIPGAADPIWIDAAFVN